jgi:Fic family protein
MIDEDVWHFLKLSNAIEREYSVEALEDAKSAWDYAYENRDAVTFDVIRSIHGLLMRRLSAVIAGNIRNVDVFVGSFSVAKKMPDCHLLRAMLDELCKYPPETEDEIRAWHVAFEKVHPFEDGNGRVGRILMNAQRVNANLPLLIIPAEGAELNEYYGWFDD